MLLHKVKKRTPELDTKVCICINNFLWNREKIRFLNGGKEFLAPKYYTPRHVGQLNNEKKRYARYKAMKPLKNLKDEQSKAKKPQRKPSKEPTYKFVTTVTASEYRQLRGFLYDKVKPNAKTKIRTIEQVIADIEKRKKQQ